MARITVQEGDRVRRGQVLATLDMTSVGASLEAADAERDRTTAELVRLRQLDAQGWITKARLEGAEAAARIASANVEARRFSLQTARVLALADGLTLSRSAEPGPIINVGMPVVIGGLLPLALSGSPLYAPLDWEIIGGVVSSTMLSRIVIPAMPLLLVRGAPPPT